MTHGAPANVVFADLVDAHGALHARHATETLDGVLHRERVHYRGQHAHVVGGHPVHAGAREAGAPEDVAAPDDAGHLHSALLDLEHFAGDALEDQRVDAELSSSEQCFARELHENAFVRRGHWFPHFAIKKTPRKAGFSYRLVLGCRRVVAIRLLVV